MYWFVGGGVVGTIGALGGSSTPVPLSLLEFQNRRVLIGPSPGLAIFTNIYLCSIPDVFFRIRVLLIVYMLRNMWSSLAY